MLTAGGVKIRMDEEKKLIFIESAADYYVFYFVFVLLIAICYFFGVLFPFKIYSWVILIILYIPLFFLLLLGFSFYKKMKSKINWKIDLDKRFFYFTEDKGTHIDDLSKYVITRNKYFAGRFVGRRSSFQLDLVHKNNNSILIVISDNLPEVDEIAQFLKKYTQLPLYIDI